MKLYVFAKIWFILGLAVEIDVSIRKVLLKFLKKYMFF